MHISGTPYATGCASISVPTYPPWTDIQRFPRKCIRAPSFTRRKVLWDGRRSSVIPCMKYQNPSLLLLLLHIRIDLTVTIRNNGFCLRIYISSRCDLSGGGGFLGRNCWWLVIYLSSVCERRWRAVCVDYTAWPRFYRDGTARLWILHTHRTRAYKQEGGGEAGRLLLACRYNDKLWLGWIPTALEPIRINQISRQEPCKIYPIDLDTALFEENDLWYLGRSRNEYPECIDPCPNFAYSNVYIYNLDMKVSKLTWNSINWTLDLEHL